MPYDLKKVSKNGRVLAIYSAFCRGEKISKQAEADRFGVDVRTIQRDIDAIRLHLDIERDYFKQKPRTIIYDRRSKSYMLEDIRPL